MRFVEQQSAFSRIVVVVDLHEIPTILLDMLILDRSEWEDGSGNCSE